jgi:hypothetical protein
VEGIRTLAVGEFVPTRLKKPHHRPDESAVGSLPANLAAAEVNETLFSLVAVFAVAAGFPARVIPPLQLG